MSERDPYLALNLQQRLELLDAASRETGLPSAIVEKDFWVCFTLDVLFGIEELSECLVFKGGTSLSKVYGIIHRFSEDIDISFHRGYLGFDGEDRDPEQASGKEQRRRLEALQEACRGAVELRLLPHLKQAFAQRLDAAEAMQLEIDPVDPQAILCHYPQAGVAALEYIQPFVKIETGARSDHWPKEAHRIRSYIGDAVDQDIGVADVHALAAERTFWEKATLLHAECYRAAQKPMPARYARHYHDLTLMAGHAVAEQALADTGLRDRVVAHKSVYFASRWARYDLAVPGSFRLVPEASRLEELKRDDTAMRQMFFEQPAALDEVLDTLRSLEDRINGR